MGILDAVAKVATGGEKSPYCHIVRKKSQCHNTGDFLRRGRDFKKGGGAAVDRRGNRESASLGGGGVRVRQQAD